MARRGDAFHTGRPGWVAVILGILGMSAVLPVIEPGTAGLLQRTTPLISLFLFLAAIGHWLRMERRSYIVAGALTGLLYAITAWTPTAFGLEDFFVVALLSSLLVFALAGFNLVFILEEVVFDIRRLSHLRHPAWRFGPTLAVLALAWLLPMAWRVGAPVTKALWVVAIAHSILLGCWWFFRAFNPVPDGRVLRELHLFVAGTLLMAGVLDTIQLVAGRPGIFPSLLAYLVLIGTWVYVSYTTLQRTHFLMGSRNAVPWLLILMSASFAIIQHAFLHYRVEGSLGIAFVLNQRLAYLVVGLGFGIAVYLAQAMWRIFRSLRDDRSLSPKGRIVAGRFARLAESLLSAEHRLIEGATASVYQGMDRLLPGSHRDPVQHDWSLRPTGWELDHETGRVRRLDSEE